MVPPGPPTPFGGSQPVPTPSFLRSTSGLLGSSGSGMPSQGAFPSMVSPGNQFGNMNMFGNMPNVSSLLQQSLANAGASPGISGPGSAQRVLVDNGAESDPLSAVGNGMGFNVPSSSFTSSSTAANANATVSVQGQQFPSHSMNHILGDTQTNSQNDPHCFQHSQQSMHQFTTTSNPQHQLQQQQVQSMRAGLGAVGAVKPEPQTTNDQSPQQLQALRSPGVVKLEPQQLPITRSLASVKMEPQNSDTPLFLHQQQQQQQQQQHQQFLHSSRQSPQAAAAAQLLHQQRLAQIQHQQQQLSKATPQQRALLQQQFQAQNLPIRSPAKPIYEPGMCARRLTHYMYQQQHRPEDNNIEYWKKFVGEYFAPNAKKKWCVSMYGSGRPTTGVFPQDIWHCEICNRKPGRGFEATVEVLPRLFKIKYESGTLEELLYVDMPREYQNSSGQIVLDYAKAIQESVFEQLRVVRDGQLRIVFSQDLKICSWEFCARRHEELIPRRLLIPQVNHLGAAAQKYQVAIQSAPTNMSSPDLQNNCNMFVNSARQLAKTLDVPLVNDLGYSKRYVRCLQISEVVNSMKDLIDFTRESGIGPMESLAKFPRRTGSYSGFNGQPQQTEDPPQQQQTTGPNSNGDACGVQAASMQLSCSNGMLNVDNALNPAPPTSSAGAVARLLHQNSMNSRQQNQMNSGNSPYGGTSSSTLPQTQPIPSPFQSPTPPSNNPQQASHCGGISTETHINSASSPNISLQQTAIPSDTIANDSQSSVQKIIQEMMTSSQLGGGGGGGMMGLNNMGNDMKNPNGILPPANKMTLSGNNSLMGNGFANSHAGLGGSGFGSLSNGLGQDNAMVNGIRAAFSNNSMTTNGRVGMTFARQQSMNQQHDFGNQSLSGLGAVNGFNNLQFDWKASP